MHGVDVGTESATYAGLPWNERGLGRAQPARHLQKLVERNRAPGIVLPLSDEVADGLIGPVDLALCHGNAGGQRHHDTRERLPVLHGIESRPMPVFLEDDVIVTAHDECGGILVSGVVGRRLQRRRVERLELGSDAGRRGLIATRNELARLVKRGRGPRDRQKVTVPENRIAGAGQHGHDGQRENDPLPHASHFTTPLIPRPEGRTGPQYRASPPASSSSWVTQSGHSGR